MPRKCPDPKYRWLRLDEDVPDNAAWYDEDPSGTIWPDGYDWTEQALPGDRPEYYGQFAGVYRPPQEWLVERHAKRRGRDEWPSDAHGLCGIVVSKKKAEPCTDPDKMLGASGQNPFDHPLQKRMQEVWRQEKDRMPQLPSDADILRKAAEIIKREELEKSPIALIFREPTKMAGKLNQLADKLEAPPKPVEITTTWTNADPRPFADSLFAYSYQRGAQLTGRAFQYDEVGVKFTWTDGTEGALKPDEPWPNDLYWTRLPDVEDKE